MENEQPHIKMVLPSSCPHCNEEIVVTVVLPQPSAMVSKRGEVGEDVENVIESNKDENNDLTKEDNPQ